MGIRTIVLAALAAATFLAGGESRAAFTYSSSQAPTTVTVGGSTLTLSGTTGGPLSGTTNIKSVNVALTSTTVPPATNAMSLTFNDTVTINTVGDGSTSFVVNETLNFTRSDAQGSTSTLTVNSITPGTITTNLFRYTLTAVLYAQPTVNGRAGSISYTITETALVPEPASVAMVAMGLGGLAVARVRRKRTA